MAYFLARPDGRVDFLNLGKNMIDLTLKQGGDLAVFDWNSTDRNTDQATVRLAIRQGIACTAGIVIDAGVFDLMERPGEVRKAQAGAAELAAKYPGIPSYPHLHGQVGDQLQIELDKAEGRLQAALERDPDPGLVSHWTGLGGYLPNPL
jgi:hypothetical protein